MASKTRIKASLNKTQSQKNIKDGSKANNMQLIHHDRPFSTIKERHNLLSPQSKRPTSGIVTETIFNATNNKVTNEEPRITAERETTTNTVKETRLTQKRGSANLKGKVYPKESLLRISNGSFGNEFLSRPQTGKTYTLREGQNDSKAHSITYFNGSGKVSPIKHIREQTLLSALGHQGISMTISHISLGGGLMSKKKRQRNATLNRLNETGLNVDFREVLLDENESKRKVDS